MTLQAQVENPRVVVAPGALGPTGLLVAVSVTSRSQGHKAREETEEWSVIFLNCPTRCLSNIKEEAKSLGFLSLDTVSPATPITPFPHQGPASFHTSLA